MPSGWPTSLQLVKDLDRTSCSIKSEESTSTDELDDDQNNDGEGVWSPDIEQSFHVRLLFCSLLLSIYILINLGSISYLSSMWSKKNYSI
jgi:hypothetical protein